MTIVPDTKDWTWVLRRPRYFLHDPVHHLHDVTGRRAAQPAAG